MLNCLKFGALPSSVSPDESVQSSAFIYQLSQNFLLFILFYRLFCPELCTGEIIAMTFWAPIWLVKDNQSPQRKKRTDRTEDRHHFGSRSSKESQTSVERPFETSSWKPVTLRPPFLLGIVAITLGFIALLEYLSQRSRMYGGIAFAKDQFSPAVTFAYLYFPTLIAVLYSMLWSWVDLDTKRLEPYFQLSRPEGADRTNSLALNYPFDFVAYAPLKAIRRRCVD